MANTADCEIIMKRDKWVDKFITRAEKGTYDFGMEYIYSENWDDGETKRRVLVYDYGDFYSDKQDLRSYAKLQVWQPDTKRWKTLKTIHNYADSRQEAPAEAEFHEIACHVVCPGNDCEYLIDWGLFKGARLDGVNGFVSEHDGGYYSLQFFAKWDFPESLETWLNEHEVEWQGAVAEPGLEAYDDQLGTEDFGLRIKYEAVCGKCYDTIKQGFDSPDSVDCKCEDDPEAEVFSSGYIDVDVKVYEEATGHMW